MKILFGILFLLVPMVAFAQNHQGMNQENMQQMMQQMQKMQACMQNVDQGQLQMIQERASSIELELKSLCDAGKRDAALKKAISFGKEMANDPALAAMRKCSEMMPEMPQGMMQGMTPEIGVIEEDYNDASTHVCDGL